MVFAYGWSLPGWLRSPSSGRSSYHHSMSVGRAIDLAPIHSNSLAAVGYDSTTRTLRVNFRNGGLYDYYEVAREVYEGLLASQPHPWSSWGRHITGSYRYQRVS